MPAGAAMGHVHLHVGDVGGAAAFYSEGLGFDRTVWSYPGALFLGAGGYHHHLGTNSWAGPGARPAAADDARLLEWTVVLPTSTDVDAAAGRVARAGFATRRDGRALLADDPWGTTVRITL
jgi:catechol 2,3-dioxygenase